MNKITFGFVSLAVSLSGFAVLSVAGASAAGTSVATPAVASSISKTDACKGLTEIDPGQDCSTNGSGVTGIIRAVVTILSIVIGIAAVIMVLLGGFKYTTSGGDANRISSAKNTLVYALVGLVIAALAQVLVHFVIGQAVKAAGSTITYRTISQSRRPT